MESPELYQVKASEIKSDSVEKCWIPLWNKVSKAVLSEDQATHFVLIALMSEEDAKGIVNEAIAKNDFMVQLVHKSMTARFNIKLDYKLTLWLGIILNSPGNAVMFFTYLKWKIRELDLAMVSFEFFSDRVFPIGYPTQEELQWLWNCQKININDDSVKIPYTGNLLDCPEALESIFVK